MNKNHTNISGNLVTLNLQDLQETAGMAVATLTNQAINYAELMRRELNKTSRKKEDRDENFRVSTKLNAGYLKGVAEALVIATRTLDAVYAAEDREEVIVVK